jgi:hypothetical protein
MSLLWAIFLRLQSGSLCLSLWISPLQIVHSPFQFSVGALHVRMLYMCWDVHIWFQDSYQLSALSYSLSGVIFYWIQVLPGT